jgi:hypothetical protein
MDCGTLLTSGIISKKRLILRKKPWSRYISTKCSALVKLEIISTFSAIKPWLVLFKKLTEKGLPLIIKSSAFMEC